MPMHTLKSVLASIILLALSAAAQTPAKPAPELKKLDYFSGNWTTDATIAPGPWGNGGQFTSTSANEWKPDGSALVCHRQYSMPPELGGNGTATLTLGYDSASHSYTGDESNTEGHVASKGTLTGDTWLWTGSRTYNDMEILQRMTLTPLSPSSYTMKLETSIDGVNWMTFMEGKVTKK